MAYPLLQAPIVQSFLPPAPVNEKPKPPSALWKGFVVIVKFIYEIAAKVGLLIIFGVIAHFLLPCIAPAFFAASIAIVATRLVTKILDLYDLEGLDKAKKNIFNVVDRYKLDLITFVFSAAIGPVSLIASCIIASAAGIACGFLLGVKISERGQEQEREALKAPKPTTIQTV